jgi:uncharacterized membrane protein
MNNDMPKSLQRWEKTRQKGKAKFIVQNGILMWGLPMFAVITFLVGRRHDHPLTPLAILVSACIWALGGAVYGWTVWTITEKKYEKFLARRIESQQT